MLESQQLWFNPGLIVERFWIRPTAKFLKLLVRQAINEGSSDFSFEEVMGYQLRTFLSGGLMLVRRDTKYEAVPVKPDFGKNKDNTNDFLLGTYQSLLKYRIEEDG